MKKRILSVLLCLTMFVTLMPTTAWADNADDPDPQEEVIQEQPSPEDGDPVPEEPAPEEDEPAPALTAPEIGVRPYDEETSSDMVLSVPGEWDSYAWEAYFGGDWMPCDEETSAAMVLNKEVYVQYGFRCTVTKDGQSVTSPAYAYDDAVWESSDMMRYDVRNSTSDSLTGSSAFIQFYKNSRNRFDIHGIDGKNNFKTTFFDGGYRTAVSLDDDATRAEVPYTGSLVTVGPSLTARTALSVVYGGRYVQITYKVTNNGSTTKEFQIGSSADVMIDNNDRAQVVGSPIGLTMSGSPKNNYTFNLVAPTCDTLWYGFWTEAYDNIFKDLANKITPYSKDSGMAWSWSGSVAPGETWTRYVFIGAGELPEPPQAPNLTTRTVTAGATEIFTGTGEAGTTVHITVAGQEATAVVADGKFTANILIPANYQNATADVTYWATTEDGGISEMKTATVNVLRQPQITLTTDATTVMEEETLSDSWYDSFVKSSVGTVSHTEINTNTPGTRTVTYTAVAGDFPSATATLTVNVLSKPAELSVTTATRNGDFTLSATMTHTGGLTYTETGFVYGALQNPTLKLNDGYVTTASVVNTKDKQLTATVAASSLVAGVNYYARAYAKTGDGTVIYGAQSSNFGLDVPSYGTFSVANNGDNTFTISRTGSDGDQTVYYRTVNGSAVGGTHFTHAAGTLTFAAGVTEQTVEVTELGVTNAYNSKPATAYSNADRTYSLEIYRVEGGATIGTSTATRTITKDDNYMVDRQMFNDYQSTTPSGQTLRGDYDDDHLGWTDNDKIGSAASCTVDFSDILPKRKYWQETAQKLLYKFSMQAKEAESGYQHIQLVTGSSIDTSFFPYQGKYRARGTSTEITDLSGTGYTAFYAATFEHGSTSKDTSYATYYFPSSSGSNPSNCNIKEISKTDAIEEDHFVIGAVVNGVLQVGSSANSKITVGFGGSGDSSDKWYSNQETHYFKLEDTREPQLLGIAPMAGGTYLPGQSVTVSLVFDEIVDSANSSSLSNVSINTNWGTFTYAGGANTNVLYFTGTVSDTASGNLTVNSINNADKIKDMATGGTATTGSNVSNGGTEATLGTTSAPTVFVDDINNTNGTLTATITAANAGKLEYVWSDSPTAPTTGWQIITSGKTAATRQAIGTWYLHARATNNDGWAVYAKQSYTLSGGGTVTLPNLTLSVDNSVWAKERAITVTPSPESATVKVSGPGISEGQTVSGDAYIATQNGVYTFTLTSGGETVTKTATVSKLDTTAPTVTVHDLTNRNHTEKVTLTVTAADAESGVSTVTGTWTNGSDTRNATFTASGDGTWTTTSPDESGTWTLSVTATDAVGNTASATSAVYTINADRPTLEVNQTDSTSTGVTYSYSVADNGNTGITVRLPDGTTTTEPSGSFTITEPGTYTISVTDDAGHFVSQSITVEAPSEGTLDGVKPGVRCDTDPWTWTNGNVTVTVNIYEAGGLSTVTWSKDAGTEEDLTTDVSGEAGSYTASFTATANGTYTVTATDRVGNEGKATVTIDFIDKAKPTMTATGIASGWTSTAQTVTLTAADAASGVKSVKYAVASSKTTAPTSLTDLPENKQVTVSDNGTHYIYYKVTDNAGNELTDWTAAIQIDATVPTLTLAPSGNSKIAITKSFGVSGGSVTVNGAAFEEAEYTPTAAGTYTVIATSSAGKSITQTIQVYAVTFASNGGSEVTGQLVVHGGKATQPTNPTRNGYTFGRWQKDGSAFDFGTAITSNTALTAQWTAISATPPNITQQPSGLSLTYGYTSGNVLTVTASAEADHNLSYQWYSNAANSTSGGTIVSGATASSYTVPTGKTVGNYYYYCVVTATRSDNDQTASATSSVAAVTVSKADQTAPGSGVGYTIDYASETITGGEGYELAAARDATTGNNTLNLTPGTNVYVRLKETDTQNASLWTEITIPARPATPAAPSVASKTDTSITVTEITGQEYSLDGVNWQSSGTFTGLTTGTDYTIYTRVKATDNSFASANSSLAVTTKASAPAAPTVDGSYAVSGTDSNKFTYTVTPVDGAEYSKDGTTWQDSNVFDNLAPESRHTFYVRIKETETVVAGNVGSKTVTLNKLTTGSGSVTLEGWTYGETANPPRPCFRHPRYGQRDLQL